MTGKYGESHQGYVKTDNQKFHLGTLNSKTIPHVSYCLVFDKEFELSHEWKYGEISFTEITMASELFSYIKLLL
jgi:nucleophosmin 1